jgi:hypothetical protein
MKKRLTTIMRQLKNRNFTVIRVSKNDFELDNGDIYPHTFELDEDISVEEFQRLLTESQSTMITHLNKIIGEDNEQ